MSPAKLTIAALFGLFAATVASLLLVEQHRALTALRKENLGQSSRLEQLTLEARDLSNRLARATFAPLKPPDPSAELLRLRGEVGVLRRQLQERQPVGQGSDSTLSAGVPLRQIEQLRIRGQAVCERLKALHDQMQASGSDPEALLQGIRTNGIHDYLLDAFQTERTTLAEALKSSQISPDQRETLNGLVANANRKISDRLDGYLVGLDVRTESLQNMLEKLPHISSDERLSFISDLDQAVRTAEDLVGRSP